MRNSIMIAGLLLALPAAPAGTRPEPAPPTQALFSPTGGKRLLTARLVREIGGAKKEVTVALYHFTSDRLSQALANAHRMGVRVRVLLDGHQSGSARGRFARAWQGLQKAKVPLRFVYADGVENKRKRSSASLPKFHHKFCVIDRSKVLTGSFNWTVLADEKNHENLLVISDRRVAKQYHNRFEEVWGNPRITEK